MLPKYHLLSPYGSVHSFNTMSSSNFRALMRIAGTPRQKLSVLGSLGVRYLLLPTEDEVTNGLQLKLDAPGVENLTLWENTSCMPRCWLVHEIETLTVAPSTDPVG